MKMLCVYHKGCKDGFAAATVANVWAKENNYQVDFIPGQYGDESAEKVFEYLKQNQVDFLCIVDFSYKKDILLKMDDLVKEIQILDHHKTAQDELKDLPFAKFDMNESGATMTWSFFYPAKKTPAVLEYIKDRDLWLWEKPQSREVSAAIASYPLDFDLWGFWISSDAQVKSLMAEGKHILRYQNKIIENIANGDIK